MKPAVVGGGGGGGDDGALKVVVVISWHVHIAQAAHVRIFTSQQKHSQHGR